MSLTATTSRTDAHRIFANLYKKARSPEHQRKIDEILTRSNDVFIRIDLIKRLDKEYEEKQKPGKKGWFEPPRKDQTSKIKPVKSLKNSDQSAEKKEQSREEETKSQAKTPVEEEVFFGDLEQDTGQESSRAFTIPHQEAYDSTKEKQTGRELARVSDENLPAVINEPSPVGIFYLFEMVRKFFQRMMGVNERISQFAEESRALHYPIFSKQPELSPEVKKIFYDIPNIELEDAILALEYCEQHGWKEWDRKVYNTVVNFHRFLRYFADGRKKFQDGETPLSFLLQTKRMQTYYARHLKRKNGGEIILSHVITFIKREPILAKNLDKIKNTLKQLTRLEKIRPRFTEVITSLYILEHQKMIYWHQVESALKVPPIDDSQYECSNQVAEQIKVTLENHEKELRDYTTILAEKDLIRKKFFQFNDKGKVVCGFLNFVVKDFIQNYYFSDEGQESLRWKFKNYPHWLFLLVCRDLRSIYGPILSDYIAVEETYIKNVLIFNKNLFFNELELLETYLTKIEDFHRSYPEFALTFDKLNSQYMTKSSDRAELQFFSLIAEAADTFGQMAKKLHIILNNHRMAKEIEKRNKLTNEIRESSQAAITDTKIRARFIPYYNGMVVSGNRLNRKILEQIIQEMATYLFNYAVIFKNSSIINMITSREKLVMEINKSKKEYYRLSGEEFSYKSIWSQDTGKTPTPD